MAAFSPLVPQIVMIVGVRCVCGWLTTASMLALAPGNERRFAYRQLDGIVQADALGDLLRAAARPIRRHHLPVTQPCRMHGRDARR